MKASTFRKIRGNLVKVRILKEALNPYSMNTLEEKQHNPMHQEGPHYFATIVAWKSILRWIVDKRKMTSSPKECKQRKYQMERMSRREIIFKTLKIKTFK